MKNSYIYTLCMLLMSIFALATVPALATEESDKDRVERVRAAHKFAQEANRDPFSDECMPTRQQHDDLKKKIDAADGVVKAACPGGDAFYLVWRALEDEPGKLHKVKQSIVAYENALHDAERGLKSAETHYLHYLRCDVNYPKLSVSGQDECDRRERELLALTKKRNRALAGKQCAKRKLEELTEATDKLILSKCPALKKL